MVEAFSVFKEAELCQIAGELVEKKMTLQIDDAGAGDLLSGVAIGAYRPESKEFAYAMIDVSLFQRPRFSKKPYIRRATQLVLQLVKQLNLSHQETVEICSSYIFEDAVRELRRELGDQRVKVSAITGDAQELVENAYIDEVRKLGYEPIPEREKHRARSFFDMLRWVKRNPERFKNAKTGWPRLQRYLQPKSGRDKRDSGRGRVTARRGSRTFYRHRR